MDEKRDKLDHTDAATTKGQDQEQPSGQSPDARRRALIAGLIAAPAVFTLMSRSAWAAVTPCSLVSSFTNGGNKFVSPGLPGHNVTITNGDVMRCSNNPAGRPL